MTTVTESDIKELKDLINSRFDRLEVEQSKQSEQIKNLQISMGEFKGKLSVIESSVQKIPDLAERTGEIKNWKQVSLVIITAFVSSVFSGLIGGVIGWLIRGGKI